MAAEAIILDPTSEDAGNTQLTLTDTASGIEVITQTYGRPDRKRITSSSPDTIGERVVNSQRGNRVIEYQVRCFGASMLSNVKALQRKVGKLSQSGGTVKRTLGSGEVIVFDVLDADVDVPADHLFANFQSATCTVTLLCLPLGRGPEAQLATFSETSLPAAVFAFAAPAGDVPALGRLEVTEAQGVDQAFLQWGVECAGYQGTAAASALLFAGTSRLAYNGATALAVSGAASGSVLNQGSLTASYAVLSGLQSTGGVYPVHVGTYDVWARLYMGTANAGTVTAALEWAQGDLLNYTRNDGTILDPTRKGGFLHVNLGQVALEKVTSGAQRWDARLIAKSTTVGDDLAVDEWELFPVLEGYGEARAVSQSGQITTYTAWDDFNAGTHSGDLPSDVLPTGGTWTAPASSYAGTVNDFAVSGGVAQRTAVSDTSTDQRYGRWLYASATTGMVNQSVQVDYTTSVALGTNRMGVVFRAVDRDNFAVAYYRPSSGTLQVVKVVAGVASTIGSVVGAGAAGPGSTGRILVVVTASGAVSVRGCVATTGSDPGTPVQYGSFQDAALASGGALASGYAGIYDWNSSAAATTRTYDNFYAWAPTSDAALFAAKKATVYHDRFRRQDSAGTAVGKAGDYRGDYLRIPAANVGGTVRMIVKGCRGIPEWGTDSAVDDIGGTVWATPLYLNVPEP